MEGVSSKVLRAPSLKRGKEEERICDRVSMRFEFQHFSTAPRTQTLIFPRNFPVVYRIISRCTQDVYRVNSILIMQVAVTKP